MARRFLEPVAGGTSLHRERGYQVAITMIVSA